MKFPKRNGRLVVQLVYEYGEAVCIHLYSFALVYFAFVTTLTSPLPYNRPLTVQTDRPCSGSDLTGVLEERYEERFCSCICDTRTLAWRSIQFPPGTGNWSPWRVPANHPCLLRIINYVVSCILLGGFLIVGGAIGTVVGINRNVWGWRAEWLRDAIIFGSNYSLVRSLEKYLKFLLKINLIP